MQSPFLFFFDFFEVRLSKKHHTHSLSIDDTAEGDT